MAIIVDDATNADRYCPTAIRRHAMIAATRAASGKMPSHIRLLKFSGIWSFSRRVQATIVVNRMNAAIMRRGTRCRTRSSSSSSTFRQRNIPPCRESITTATAPSAIAYGLSRARKSASMLPSASIGTPWMTLPSATPSRMVMPSDEPKNVQSHSDAPGPARALRAELDGDGAQDEHQQHQHHRQVEAAEQRRVDDGESGEQGPAREDQPHLVAVPDRADAVEQDVAVRVRPCPTIGASIPTPRSNPSRMT